jgi:hypothetical protein
MAETNLNPSKTAVLGPYVQILGVWAERMKIVVTSITPEVTPPAGAKWAESSPA